MIRNWAPHNWVTYISQPVSKKQTSPDSLAVESLFLTMVLYSFRTMAQYWNYLLTCPISLPDWKHLESKDYFLVFVTYPGYTATNWTDKELAILESQQVEKEIKKKKNSESVMSEQDKVKQAKGFLWKGCKRSPLWGGSIESRSPRYLRLPCSNLGREGRPVLQKHEGGRRQCVIVSEKGTKPDPS